MIRRLTTGTMIYGHDGTQRRACGLLFMALCVLAVMMWPRAAPACDQCACVPAAHGVQIPHPPGYTISVPGERLTIRGIVRDEHQITTDQIVEEFDDFEPYLIDVVFMEYIRPALMMMTEQLVHTALYQTKIIGSQIDGKMHMETQAVFQHLTAQAHKDYHPTVEMCVFGTNVRSLAAAERNAEYTAFVLSQRSMDRQMANANSAAARGSFDDECFRLRQFRQFYCTADDNNARMLFVCDPAAAGFDVQYPECLPPGREVTQETENKDVSFMRTVDRAATLEIDFYTGLGVELSPDERDVFALASNLYSSDVMFRLPEASLQQRGSQDELLDMRAVVAKRSVAEHSFNTIVGMKAQGTELSEEITYPFMRLILERLHLGDDGAFPEEEIAMYLGTRPSYYAQMEVLTKRLYQTPDFFAGLYDEPVNVERKGVTLQAIGLMQDFDTWNSYLRTEAMLSVMLELELLRMQNQVQNLLGDMRSGGIEL